MDCVMSQAIERGIQNILVDFGQDVRVRGHALDKEFWWIGLEDATRPGKCWAGVAVGRSCRRHFRRLCPLLRSERPPLQSHY